MQYVPKGPCAQRFVCFVTFLELYSVTYSRAWRGEWRGGRTVRQLRTNECREDDSICSQNATNRKTTNFAFPRKTTTKHPKSHKVAYTAREEKPLISRFHTKLRPNFQSCTSVSLVYNVQLFSTIEHGSKSRNHGTIHRDTLSPYHIL